MLFHRCISSLFCIRHIPIYQSRPELFLLFKHFPALRSGVWRACLRPLVVTILRGLIYFSFAITLLMSQGQCSAEKKSHSVHDNCQNCVRERKENQSFIKIYQRLQEVEQKTHRISKAIQDHKISSDTNRSFYRSLEQKIVSLPKVQRQTNLQAMENVGFELAANILEKDHKHNLQQENDRLKKLLNQMRIEKWQQKAHAQQQMIASSCFTQRKASSSNSHQLDRTFNSCQAPPAAPRPSDTQNLQKLLLSGQHNLKDTEITTQSSSFSVSPLQRSLDLSKYNDLNLWLYQSEKNSRLQEELYRTNQSTQVKFESRGKKEGVVKRITRALPMIRGNK